MSRPASPEARLIELVVQAQLGSLEPGTVAELQGLLQDPGLRRLYVELINLQGHLETSHTRRAGEDRAGQAESADLLAVLRQAEDTSPVVAFPPDQAATGRVDARGREDGLTFRATASALSYLFRRHVLQNGVMVGAAAAVLVIGGLLAVLFLSGPGPNRPAPGPPLAQNDSPVVATLTDVDGAQWEHPPGSAVPRPGDPLQAGQRLTLTEGFATITTRRGAVALLEAPCTIELIDHDNALRLHRGKLVGICQADSSKGFLVRTRHMDIVDLGTRFGVDASGSDATSVHVFEGAVEAALPSASGGQGGRQVLSAGQAARASDGGSRLVRIGVEPARFAAIVAPRFLPTSTGLGLAVGEADPNWRLVAMNGRPVEEPLLLRVTDRPEATKDRPKHLESVPFQWLTLPDSYTEQFQVYSRLYACRSTFELPPGIDLSQADLVLGFQGGRAVSAVRVNNRALPLPEAVTNKKTFYNPFHEQVIDPYLTDGTNTIEIELYDTDTHTTFRVGLELKPEHSD